MRLTFNHKYTYWKLIQHRPSLLEIYHLLTHSLLDSFIILISTVGHHHTAVVPVQFQPDRDVMWRPTLPPLHHGPSCLLLPPHVSFSLTSTDQQGHSQLHPSSGQVVSQSWVGTTGQNMFKFFLKHQSKAIAPRENGGYRSKF